MSPKLLPCPFCGSARIEDHISFMAAAFFCDDCNAVGPSVGRFFQERARSLRARARRAWNERAKPQRSMTK